MMPPIIGATMKSQSCARASPPTNTAGPRLLAGFTDVPVIGMPTRCISTRVKPMATPANPLGASLWVAPKIANRNMAVSTTSAIKQAAS